MAPWVWPGNRQITSQSSPAALPCLASLDVPGEPLWPLRLLYFAMNAKTPPAPSNMKLIAINTIVNISILLKNHH
jgi:hypothetical protein